MAYRLSHQQREICRRGIAESRRQLASAHVPPAPTPSPDDTPDQRLPYRDAE